MLNELVEADKLLARIALSGDALLRMADARRLMAAAYLEAKEAAEQKPRGDPDAAEQAIAEGRQELVHNQG